MKTINNSQDLKNAILELERKKDVEENELKEKFHETYESYKPANLLKNTMEEVAASPKFRHNLLNVAIGLGAGYLSKKLVIGKSAGIVKRVLGTALQFGITSLVAKKGEQITDQLIPKKKSLLKRILSI
jgi:hypothetical protein